MNYLDRISKGYVNALSKFNRLDERVRQMFAHNHITGGEIAGDYLRTMMEKNEARKMLDRWYNVFISATKRIAK